jgi:hypothetical protein
MTFKTNGVCTAYIDRQRVGGKGMLLWCRGEIPLAESMRGFAMYVD